MTFHVRIHEYRYKLKLVNGLPFACVLPKRPAIKRIKETFETQAGVMAFAGLMLRHLPPHPMAIPCKPRSVSYVNHLGEEVTL